MPQTTHQVLAAEGSKPWTKYGRMRDSSASKGLTKCCPIKIFLVRRDRNDGYDKEDKFFATNSERYSRCPQLQESSYLAAQSQKKQPHRSFDSNEDRSAHIMHAIVENPVMSDGHSTNSTSPSFLALWQDKFLAYVLMAAVIIICALRPRTKSRLPPGVKRLPRLPGLPYFGRFWDVPDTGIESAWHFGKLHDTYGPIYEWKVSQLT